MLLIRVVLVNGLRICLMRIGLRQNKKRETRGNKQGQLFKGVWLQGSKKKNRAIADGMRNKAKRIMIHFLFT